MVSGNARRIQCVGELGFMDHFRSSDTTLPEAEHMGNGRHRSPWYATITFGHGHLTPG